MNVNQLSRPPLIALLGPTAVGKTAVSLALARFFPLEIVSADSRLFYRGMDIGTAKPTEAERREVPHHLIDVTSADQPWSLAKFRVSAYQAIDGIHAAGKIPMIVGGTGQYIAALLEGWQPPPRSHSDKTRIELQDFAAKHGSAALHARLEALDPVAAEHIDHRNIRRVIRALEIIKLTGKPASEQRTSEPPHYRILRIGLTLPRDQLYSRINERIDAMLEAGWMDEVRQLLARGFDFDSAPFSAIGYRQLAGVIQGDQSLEQAREEIQRLTRQFVRRQANWFKTEDTSIQWFEMSADVVEEIRSLIARWVDQAD